MAPQSDTAKDAALRAVGRTLVNFQRLEQILKRAARLGPLQGTIGKVQRDIKRRHERADSLTLGQAIQAWLTYCDGSPAQIVGNPDLFDASIQMTFSLESDADERRSQAKALAALLELRNNLIHSRFATFQWESSESCDNLVVELDRINADIAGQLDYIGSLLVAIVALHKEHAESLSANFAAGTAIVANGKHDA